MQKYGFIYVWFDIKHKRYYIGRHWGYVDDGYVCSSNIMRDAYRRRNQDFKRRIVSYVYTSKEDLIIEEQRWLDMIKKEELGVRYYNKTKSATTPSTLGFKHSEESKIKSRISNIGKKRSDKTRQANRLASLRQFSDPEQRSKLSTSVKKLWENPDYRQKVSDAHKGKPSSRKGKIHTEETKQKLRDKRKIQAPMSEEAREKIRQYNSNAIWITNDNINKKIHKDADIPMGFRRGKVRVNK